MPVINANSVDPDQTPRSAASDLGLHRLLMSHLWDARHKWVNIVSSLLRFCIHYLVIVGRATQTALTVV